MRFIKRNLKYILPALIVFFVIVAAIANTSIRGVEKEQKKALEALNPVEIGLGALASLVCSVQFASLSDMVRIAPL